MIIPPIRRNDSHGSGEYGAPRNGRLHKGVDLACWPGSTVLSLTHGTVRKIGYPYPVDDHRRGHFRYVEVEFDGMRFRYFYLNPLVAVGDQINALDPIGRVQDLTEVYNGITPHYHFEIIGADGQYMDPGEHFKEMESL